MKHRTIQIIIPVFVLLLVGLACNFSASTANIASATMAFDEEGTQPTTTYGPSDIFYCIVELKNAPDETTVKAAWTAVDVEGVDANTAIEETTLSSGDGLLHFELSNSNLWPAGSYKVDLYLNDELDQSVEFTVE
jgi:hypothetical protein